MGTDSVSCQDGGAFPKCKAESKSIEVYSIQYSILYSLAELKDCDVTPHSQ